MTDFEKLLSELKPLLDEVSATDLSELEWAKEGRKIKIVRNPVERRKEAASEKKEADHRLPIKSSVVGIFHFFEGKPEVGQFLRKGDPLGYVVSINVKHNVDAESPGRLSEIHVEEGQAVEYGQLLFSLEPKG